MTFERASREYIIRRMKSKGRDLLERVREGLGAFNIRGRGRSSLLAAAVAPFFATRSPGAALLFVLLPAYSVLMNGDFSGAQGAAGDESTGKGGSIHPVEILARALAALIASLASFVAVILGDMLALRLGMQAFKTPWGLGVASVCVSLVLCAVHLPFLVLCGRAAGRGAGSAAFAVLGVLTLFAALRKGSMYGTFLWLFYSGGAPALYLPFLGGTALLAVVFGVVSWMIAGRRRTGR
jgi:hypothetical protein